MNHLVRNPASKPAGLLALALLFAGNLAGLAQPDPTWLIHDRTRPLPPVVEPGRVSTQEQAGRAPSDAVVLFSGNDLGQWSALDGSPTGWIIRDGALECVPGSGMIRTRQSFGDCQLHVEWATPVSSSDSGQGRGNSGVFFGMGRYEVQVLESNGNQTYADGSAGSIYGQYPPLVNASLPPGQWQVYDIIWKAPRFDSSGQLLAKARLTVFHNGVLIQDDVELTGPSSWFQREPYAAHPVKLPISFQDHGNPVRFRNVWVRQLDGGRDEYWLPDALLDSYAGDYQLGQGTVEVRRAPDGLLTLRLGGVQLLMHAASATRFVAGETDVQGEFQFTGTAKELVISVGQGEMRYLKIR